MSNASSPYCQLSDLDLFNLVKQENIEAFEVVYQRYWPELIDAAYRRLGSRQKAEDLVQELFVSLYRKRDVLEISVSLKAYLSKALKFRVLNEFRAEHVRANYAKGLFLNSVCKNDFAKDLEAKELRHRIEELIGQLPEKCRQVYYMSRDQNMTNREIALELNIAVSTVEKHIGKALKVLRSNLKEFTASL